MNWDEKNILCNLAVLGNWDEWIKWNKYQK